jgi:hypothetical protein
MCFLSDNWEALATLLLAIIGGCFALCQWRKSIKIRRGEFIAHINDRLRFDPDIAHTLYEIEYGGKWYDDKFHENRKIEFEFDKVLSFCDYICYLKSNGNISDDEFKIFKYRINRVCISQSTQCYLWNLFQFAKRNNADCSFQCLLEYGIKHNLIDKAIKSNANLFPNDKYLNF